MFKHICDKKQVGAARVLLVNPQPTPTPTTDPWAQVGPQPQKWDPRMVPGIFGSPERLTTLPQALFFFQKNGPPYFWKPHNIFGSPERLTTLPQALFFFRKMAPRFLEAAGSVVGVGVGCGLTTYFNQIVDHFL